MTNEQIIESAINRVKKHALTVYTKVSPSNIRKKFATFELNHLEDIIRQALQEQAQRHAEMVRGMDVEDYSWREAYQKNDSDSCNIEREHWSEHYNESWRTLRKQTADKIANSLSE